MKFVRPSDSHASRGMAALVVAVAALGILYPLGSLFSDLSLSQLSAVFTDESLSSLTAISVGAALVSTVISALGGLALAIFLRDLGAELDATAMSLLRWPFVIPAVSAALAWMGLLGHHGLALDRPFGWRAIILAQVFFNLPWVAFQLLEVSRSIPRQATEELRTLGYGRYRSILRAEFAIWRPTFFYTLSQVSSLCLTSFALVLILGGGPPVENLETAIYSRIRLSGIAGDEASGLVFWQLCIVATVGLLGAWMGRGRSMRLEAGSTLHRERDPGQKILGWVVAAIWVAPYFWLFFREFSPIKMARVLVDPEWLESLLVSMRVSFLTAIGVLVLGGISAVAARRETWLHAVAIAPAGVSAILLSAAYYRSYSQSVQVIEGSLMLWVMVQVFLAWPLIHRGWGSILAGNRESLREQIQTLGLSRFQSWHRAEWPRIRPRLLSIGILVFAASLGELGAASFFYGESKPPLPVLISRWNSHYQFESAAQVSLFLIGVAFALMMISDRLVNGGES